MFMVPSASWNTVKPVELELGRWELIVTTLAVEYETHRDLVLNSGEQSDEDVEFSRNQMKEVRDMIQHIEIQVGFVWFAADNVIWLENR